MSNHSHQPHPHPPPEGVPKNVYKDHSYAVRDDDDGFELWIDDRSWAHMVDRTGPGTYYSHLLPFAEYSSPDEIAQAIIDRAGEAWVDDEDAEPADGPGHHN